MAGVAHILGCVTDGSAVAEFRVEGAGVGLYVGEVRTPSTTVGSDTAETVAPPDHGTALPPVEGSK
ncbi:MAG: hypothetical protein ACQKBV_12365, partial [Puniceicoccales bacterium]